MAISTCRPSFDVLLSFRGKGTSKNFSDHLYAALVRAGFLTFIDDTGVQIGENIESAIQKAIKESKISIIVFSKDYASSTWCLDQLVMIVERKKLDGYVVLPVFYDVDPSAVRKQTGSFAEAFAEYDEWFKQEIDIVKRWRAALRDVANLAGMVLQDGCESRFIQYIVKEVGYKLNHTVLSVAPYLVGMDSRVGLINKWLQDRSDDVGIATICGISGIGKTTIAKTVYNLNFNKFEGSSFLAKIRESSEQPTGLFRLQRQLLSDLQRRKTDKIYSVDEGIIKIKDATCSKRVLLIFDDVDQPEQFHAIIGKQEWLYPGSKIIITTRNKNLLRVHEVNLMFEVQKLNDNESLQLFSWHAFRQTHPRHGYEKHSEDLVLHCCGLPLALEVMGSYLFGRTTNEWDSALQRFKQAFHPIIQKTLRTNYDLLQDDHDKRLFLHIASFFTGMDKDYVIKILDCFNFHTIVGIQNLMDRFLITIDEENKVMMLPLLRELGREIARQESLPDPRQHSKLITVSEVTSMNTRREIDRLRKWRMLFHGGQKLIEGVALERMLLLTNLALEILMVTIDQIASPEKPQYALVVLIMSLAAMFICVTELIYKGRKQNVTLNLGGVRCWFQYPFSNDKPRYGNLIDVFSLLCAISQCVCSTIAYSYLYQATENPVKVSIVSIIFIICLMTSKLVNNPNMDLPVGQKNERWITMNHIE